MIRTFEGVQDVLVHVDGEDDSHVEPLYLFTRKELRNRILPIVKETGDRLALTGLRVHHIRGQNIVDIFLRPGDSVSMTEARSLLKALRSRFKGTPGIDAARLYLDFE